MNRQALLDSWKCWAGGVSTFDRFTALLTSECATQNILRALNLYAYYRRMSPQRIAVAFGVLFTILSAIATNGISVHFLVNWYGAFLAIVLVSWVVSRLVVLVPHLNNDTNRKAIMGYSFAGIAFVQMFMAVLAAKEDARRHRLLEQMETENAEQVGGLDGAEDWQQLSSVGSKGVNVASFSKISETLVTDSRIDDIDGAHAREQLISEFFGAFRNGDGAKAHSLATPRHQAVMPSQQEIDQLKDTLLMPPTLQMVAATDDPNAFWVTLAYQGANGARCSVMARVMLEESNGQLLVDDYRRGKEVCN